MKIGAQVIALNGTPIVPEHELLRPIASGAYGQVWLARNALDVYRAVKIVHRASFDHDRPFEREFAGIKAFEPISRGHEGLVDLLQVGRDDAAGYFYYVMELADDASATQSDGVLESWSDGKAPTTRPSSAPSRHPITPSLQDTHSYIPRTLAAELKRRGRLPVEECIQIGLSLTQALAYLHGQGLVHRDIKPSNIIFVNGAPKLADVGLVTGVGSALSFVGTEGFIAPEGPGTAQADIYSLGIVLYVLSTGKSHQDFPEPPADLATQMNHGQWLEFDAVVHKACQADARQRYQSAQQMHEELALLQRGQSVKDKRAAQRRWALAKRLALAVVVLSLLVPFLRSIKLRHTPIPEAEIEYKLGQWYYNKLTPEDHTNALAHLIRAIELDPKFVEPYGPLTGIYLWELDLLASSSGTAPLQNTNKIADPWNGGRSWLCLVRSREIAKKALTVDPNAAEGHTALSYVKFLERDWHGAEDEIVRAIKLNPKFAIARFLYTFYLSVLGRTEEAHHQAKWAVELDPADRTSGVVAAWPFIAERKFDQAIAHLRGVLKLERNFPQTHQFLARCYEAQRKYAAAIPEFKTADLLGGADPAQVTADWAALLQAFETGGEQGYYRKTIELIEAERSLPQGKQLFSELDLAACYARLGEKQKALDVLEQHYDWQLKFEPLYDNLHDEPRFKALLKRAGLEN